MAHLETTVVVIVNFVVVVVVVAAVVVVVVAVAVAVAAAVAFRDFNTFFADLEPPCNDGHPSLTHRKSSKYKAWIHHAEKIYHAPLAIQSWNFLAYGKQISSGRYECLPNCPYPPLAQGCPSLDHLSSVCPFRMEV